MRKLLLLLCAVMISVIAVSAQTVTFVTVTSTSRSYGSDICTIHLSNKDAVYVGIHWVGGISKREICVSDEFKSLVTLDAWGREVYIGKIGQVICIKGNLYTPVTAQKLKTVAIKSISFADVYGSNVRNVGYAVKSVNDLIYPSKLMEQSGCVSIANVTFEDGGIVSIVIAGDPRWASITAGQKVDVCKIGDIYYYKLVF